MTRITKSEVRKLISVERAEQLKQEIWNNHGWTRGSTTEEENKIIIQYWETLPGNYSFYNVVCELAKE